MFSEVGIKVRSFQMTERRVSKACGCTHIMFGYDYRVLFVAKNEESYLLLFGGRGVGN